MGVNKDDRLQLRFCVGFPARRDEKKNVRNSLTVSDGTRLLKSDTSGQKADIAG